MENRIKPQKTLRAGFLSGLVASSINLLIYCFLILKGGHALDSTIILSIFVASLLPNLLAAFAYLGLSNLTTRALLLTRTGVVVFVLTSILPHLGIGPAPSPALSLLPEGFDLITVPLHIVFGLTAIVIMPKLATNKIV